MTTDDNGSELAEGTQESFRRFRARLRSGTMKYRLKTVLGILRGNPRLAVGAAIVVFVSVTALVAPFAAPYDPQEAHPGDQLQPPSGRYLLGTDTTGMDVLSRMMHAPRLDLTIAVVATLLSILIGTPVGLAAGFYQNFLSESAMRISDILQSFPVFVLGMALVVLTGQRLENVVVAIAIVNGPIYARLVRSQAVYVRERAFVEAARASGVSDFGIIMRYLLPNCAGPICALSSVTIGTAMLLTSGLSFIGAGVRVPTPEWGSMIAIGTPSLIDSGAWWPSVPPGVVLAITVLGFGMMGDSLGEIVDPRRRRSHYGG